MRWRGERWTVDGGRLTVDEPVYRLPSTDFKSNIYMKAPLREQLRAQSLPEDELSEAEQQLLREVIDRDLQAQWAKALAEKGVHREVSGGKIRSLRPWLAAAAAVVLLCIAGWWIWSIVTPDTQQLATQRIEQFSDPGSDFQRGETISENEQRQKNYNAYRSGNFQTALDGITATINNGTAKVNEYILAGLCNLKLSKPEAAVNHFLEARRLDSGRYADDLRLYLGLTYTLLNEKEKALEELRTYRRKTPADLKLIEALEKE